MVDDQIPCTADGTQPAFSKNHGNELWVILLEKAWAKIHGSYAAIDGGHAHFTMRDLTGAPSYDMNIHEENVFDILLEGTAKKWPMAVSICCNDVV